MCENVAAAVAMKSAHLDGFLKTLRKASRLSFPCEPTFFTKLARFSACATHTLACPRSLDLLCNGAFDIPAHIYFSCEPRRKGGKKTRLIVFWVVHNMLTAPCFGGTEGG